MDPRMSTVIPLIKCSNCGQGVRPSQLGDHVCGPLQVNERSTHLQLPTSASDPTDLYKRTSPPKPNLQPIDPRIANNSYAAHRPQYSQHLTPSTSSSTFGSPSPSPSTAGLGVGLSPSQSLPDVSLHNQGKSRLMARMETIAPGPFAVGAGPRSPSRSPLSPPPSTSSMGSGMSRSPGMASLSSTTASTGAPQRPQRPKRPSDEEVRRVMEGVSVGDDAQRPPLSPTDANSPRRSKTSTSGTGRGEGKQVPRQHRFSPSASVIGDKKFLEWAKRDRERDGLTAPPSGVVKSPPPRPRRPSEVEREEHRRTESLASELSQGSYGSSLLRDESRGSLSTSASEVSLAYNSHNHNRDRPPSTRKEELEKVVGVFDGLLDDLERSLREFEPTPTVECAEFRSTTPAPPLPTTAPPLTRINKSQTTPAPTMTRSPSQPSTCRACSLPITGRAIRDPDQKLTGKYHKSCFTCHTCRRPFPSSTFYIHDDKPMCARHYHKANRSLCHTCDMGIEGACLQRESGERHHPGCFRCYGCGVGLGEEYFEVGGRVWCERHAVLTTERMGQQNEGGLGVPTSSRGMKRRTRLLMM